MGLKDAAASTPAAVGVEDSVLAQDGQIKGIEPAQRRG